MKHKRIIITIASFVGVLALIYLGIMLSLPPVQQELLVTDNDILGEPSEAYKPVLAKIKKGEPLTPKEQRIKDEENIKSLERFDPKAAAYARKLLEQGYLEVNKSQYLSQKRKEFEQWLSDEMRRYHEKKDSQINMN